jgi:hypothetical protein
MLKQGQVWWSALLQKLDTARAKRIHSLELVGFIMNMKIKKLRKQSLIHTYNKDTSKVESCNGN